MAAVGTSTAGAAAAQVEAQARPHDGREDGWAATLAQELRSTFRSGVTRSMEWRKEQLQRIVDLVQTHEQDINDALHADLGRSCWEAFLADIHPPLRAAKDALANIDKWAKPRKVPTNFTNLPGSSEVVAEPYGVVLILGPWNVPFELVLEPLVGAIAAGNAVVLKPSEVATASSALMGRLLPQYLDSRAIRVVLGGPDTAQLLLEQKWDKIFFTGGTEIGRKVAVAAARHLTPVTLELGGKIPAYVDDSADLEVTARRLVHGMCANGGQLCLSQDYVLAHETVAAKLTEAIKRTIIQFFGEDPSVSRDFGRIVSSRHWERLDALLSPPDVARCIVSGGKRDAHTRYVAPTLLRDVPWDTRIMQEETFGPICAVQAVGSAEEAVAMLQERPKPLVLYVFTTRKSVAQLFIDTTSSGAVVVNDSLMHFTNPNLPFGGVGDSGMGAYHGGRKLRSGNFDCFSHDKAVMRRPFGGDLPLRYPPMNRSKELWLRALVRFDIFGMILLLLGLRR